MTSPSSSSSSSSKVKVIYYRRSVGQSVLVSGHHVGPATDFSFSSVEIRLRYLRLFFSMTDGSIFTHTNAAGPCQRCHFWVQVPQNLRPYHTVAFETGLPFCRLMRLAELMVGVIFFASYISRAYGGYILTRFRAGSFN
jgi:hypothetical protein